MFKANFITFPPHSDMSLQLVDQIFVLRSNQTGVPNKVGHEGILHQYILISRLKYFVLRQQLRQSFVGTPCSVQMSWIHSSPTLTLALGLAVSLHSQYIQAQSTFMIIVAFQ